MSSTITAQPLGGATVVGRVKSPSLDKIIKSAPWRKHNHLVATCKSTLEKLQTLTTTLDSLSLSSTSSPSDVATAEVILSPLLLAVDTAAVKIVTPALDALFRLFSLNLLRFTGDTEGNSVISQLFDSVFKCVGSRDELIVFSAMKSILAAFRSPRVSFSGDYLIKIVRICYNLYLGGKNGSSKICAKAVLAQIMVIVFTRVEEDSMSVNRLRIVSVSELLEFTDRNLSEGNSVQLVQNLINEVMQSNQGVNEEIGRDFENVEGKRDNLDESEEEGAEESKLREDGFTLFKNLCDFSMTFSSQEHSDEQVSVRGRILSLELLKVIMDNSGRVWGSNQRQVSRH